MMTSSCTLPSLRQIACCVANRSSIGGRGTASSRPGGGVHAVGRGGAVGRGTVAGRFRLQGPIDTGNMGEVHRAEDLQVPDGAADRLVAVKLILRHRSGEIVNTRDDAKAVERFARE